MTLASKGNIGGNEKSDSLCLIIACFLLYSAEAFPACAWHNAVVQGVGSSGQKATIIPS